MNIDCGFMSKWNGVGRKAMEMMRVQKREIIITRQNLIRALADPACSERP